MHNALSMLSTFLDTEGSFVVSRIVDIASAARHHLESVANGSGDNGSKLLYKYHAVSIICVGFNSF